MLLSHACTYGIRAALYLAYLGPEKGRGKYVPIRTLSEDLGISFHFLTKILQQLTHHRLLSSFRGPNGGISLARPASEIRLMDIVEALDGPRLFTDCVLGLPGCGDERPCALHDQWGETREILRTLFEHTSLEELVERTRHLKLRLDETGAATAGKEVARA